MLDGQLSPERSVVGAPPASGAFMSVPLPIV